MKPLLPTLLLLAHFSAFSQSSALFLDDRICSVYIEMPADSFQYLIDQTLHDRYMKALFIFDDGEFRDTVGDIGFRLRGNTSLGAAKKSFKISFNEFAPGREYQGVRKLNLRGQANDPTLLREKLYYEIWKKAGMPERRASFARLYVNGQYRGLYTNIEELDKQWLGRVKADNDGNLYKCLWPADLAWISANESDYKKLMHSAGERAYRLVTNETDDDYSRFVLLVQAINQPISNTYADNLRSILDVEGVLKAYAIDVSTGNWDDYFYLKNNYYLYDNPATGKFEWMAYDTDNSLGIDWLGRDWAHRDCLDWENHSEPRPLATQLLDVPEFKSQFIRYLDTLSRFITCPDNIYPRIDSLHAFITADAEADPFRPLDFGYDINDFHTSFTQPIDNHTPYGLKPFFSERCNATRTRIEGLISGIQEPAVAPGQLWIAPNPATDHLSIDLNRLPSLESEIFWEITASAGRVFLSGRCHADLASLEIALPELPKGIYFLQVKSGGRYYYGKFVRV